MTPAQFRNAMCVLTSIDRHEAEALGLFVANDAVQPLDRMAADAAWFRFRDDPFRFFLRADDETAAKLWSIVERRTTRG